MKHIEILQMLPDNITTESILKVLALPLQIYIDAIQFSATYSVTKAYGETSTSPAEPAEVEIFDIRVTYLSGGTEEAPWEMAVSLLQSNRLINSFGLFGLSEDIEVACWENEDG